MWSFGTPLLEHIGAVGDHVLRLLPVVAILLNDMTRNGEVREVGQEFGDVWHLAVEGDLESPVVDRAHADLIDRQLSFGGPPARCGSDRGSKRIVRRSLDRRCGGTNRRSRVP